ncbi:MAG: hypothetical protein H0W87_07510 [Actinobacteria bacterium]|nr:hypothetical protein [Actinomycetota bacterium]
MATPFKPVEPKVKPRVAEVVGLGLSRSLPCGPAPWTTLASTPASAL